MSATLLVVDDDPGITHTWSKTLRLEGFNVLTAPTAERGLWLAKLGHPDAIILDFHMPIVDGLDFLRRLRALEDHRKTPVVIITGDYFLEEDITSELRALGAEMRFKPFYLEEVIEVTKELLRVTH
jgi:DNA-binding response OmpR family regulator